MSPSALMFYCFGFAMPFTSAFALSGWINMPVIFGTLCLLLSALKIFSIFNHKDAWVLFLFLLPATLSFFLNYFDIFDSKLVTHFLSYLFVFFIFYMPAKIGFTYYYKPFFNGIASGLVIAILYEYIEFIFVNFVSIDSLSFIPRTSAVKYIATSMNSIVRARSFVEESGHFALYIGIFAALSLLWVRELSKSIALVSMSILGVILTFSASGYVLTILSTIVGFVFYKRRIGCYEIICIVFLLSTLYLLYIIDFPLLVPVLEKIGSVSLGVRYNNIVESLSLFCNGSIQNIIFGLGPGYYRFYNLEPVIGYAPLALFQTGVFGFVCYLIFGIILFIYANRYPSYQRFILIFALCYSSIFYIGISNYWYPWVWVLYAYINTGIIISNSDMYNQRAVSNNSF